RRRSSAARRRRHRRGKPHPRPRDLRSHNRTACRRRASLPPSLQLGTHADRLGSSGSRRIPPLELLGEASSAIGGHAVIGALLPGVPSGIGYPLLFGFVFAESAGALVPGETALTVAAALAGIGKLSLPLVIALAALGAVLGDNLGYMIGRTALRRLLARSGAMRSRRARAIQRSEAFFNRHARAAVFFGRWLPGLRVVA